MQHNPFFEILPLITFFITYYITKDLYLATGICIIASWIYLSFCKIKYGMIAKNTWINTILITLLGGLTIGLHNKTFVMLKPTALFWIVGSSILAGHVLGKNGLKLMLSKELSLPQKLWNQLNVAWGIFFMLMGCLNLFVAFSFSEYIWVKFKVFGSLGLTIMFMLLCGIFVYFQQKPRQ